MLTGGYDLWDPLASAVVRDPSIIQTREARLRVVEGTGLDGGRLVEDPGGASVTYATAADRARFEALLLGALRTGAARGDAFSPVATVEVTAGDGVCDVTAPDPMPRGLVGLRLTARAAGPASALLFGLQALTWAEIQAFAAKPDFEHPPAVQQIAAAYLDAAGTATAYGDVIAGPLGLACAVGSFDAPTIQLRGPFQVAP
jgi:hypothetical protein